MSIHGNTPKGVFDSLFAAEEQFRKIGGYSVIEEGLHSINRLQDDFNVVAKQQEALRWPSTILDELSKPATQRIADEAIRGIERLNGAPNWGVMDGIASVMADHEAARQRHLDWIAGLDRPTLMDTRLLDSGLALKYARPDYVDEIEADPFPLETEDRIETLEAENQALASRCEALERELSELKMRRRAEVLDGSVEHTPDLPVIDSQFPDN